jgi:hypothetical protein
MVKTMGAHILRKAARTTTTTAIMTSNIYSESIRSSIYEKASGKFGCLRPSISGAKTA